MLYQKYLLTCDAPGCASDEDVLFLPASGEIQFSTEEGMRWELVPGSDKWLCAACVEKMKAQAPAVQPNLRKRIAPRPPVVQPAQVAPAPFLGQVAPVAPPRPPPPAPPSTVQIPPVGQSAAQSSTVQIPPVGQPPGPTGLQPPQLAGAPYVSQVGAPQPPQPQMQVAPDGSLLPVPSDKMPFKFEVPTPPHGR